MRLNGLKTQLERMVPVVEQVMHQAKQRLFKNNTRVAGKIVSVFETATQVIRKGKAAKPTEFGRLIRIQEAENQIVTDYEVCDRRPADNTLLVKSIEAHQEKLGRVPEIVAADAACYSAKNEKAAKEMGVQQFAVPNRKTTSAERRRLQKESWFRRAQAWRTGCEGRISVLKRRHGLNRCRYRGDDGMKRWVGLRDCGQSDQYRKNFGPPGGGSLKNVRKERIGATGRLTSRWSADPKGHFCDEK
jgi:IS5 family transposase